MRISLTGVSCVGKTTVGKKLAALFCCPFFDFDDEIESFFSTPLERLQDKFLTMYSFRQEASKALKLTMPQTFCKKSLFITKTLSQLKSI